MTDSPDDAPRPLIAGNWKMNGLRDTGVALVEGLIGVMGAGGAQCDVLVCPPATLLSSVGDAIGDGAVALGAQDCHFEAEGAHTGDISPAMLVDLGCRFVIVGHSERRMDHGEDDALVRAKAGAARRAGLVPIVCVGETLEEREAGNALEVVSSQIAGSVPEGLSADGVVVAYEPVWAIGTGLTPTVEDIAEVHGRIRADLAPLVDGAAKVRILYGGSLKPGNAREILAVANVDGGLIGGASLNAEDFWAICQACP